MVYNHPGGLLFLCFNLDGEAGLESHGEMVSEDGDFLDVPFDQGLVKLRNVGILPGDEILQLPDPAYDFFPVLAVKRGSSLLVAQPENFIGDGVIILPVVRFFDEFFCSSSNLA